MKQYYDHKKQPINLVGASFSGGGEGSVHKVIGHSHLCAKIYTENDPNDPKVQARNKKLRVMINNPIRVRSKVAWPKSLLFDQNQNLVGFVMPLLPGKQNTLYDVFFYPPGTKWSNLLNVAVNLGKAIAELHEAGVVVGDLNESNIMVDGHGMISVVDCDSMQVTDPQTGEILPCPVGKDEYRAPEILIRNANYSRETDLFALGIHICRLLLCKAHPFFGAPNQHLADNIKGNDTFLNDPGLAPTGTVTAEVLPDEIRDLFARCIIDGHTNPHARPQAEEWVSVLRKYESRLQKCRNVHTHVYSSHLTQCPWCAHHQQHGIDIFYPGSTPNQQAGNSNPKPSFSSQIPFSTQIHWGGSSSSVGQPPPGVWSSGVWSTGTPPPSSASSQTISSSSTTPVQASSKIPIKAILATVAVIALFAFISLYKPQISESEPPLISTSETVSHYQGQLSIGGKKAQWVTLSLSSPSGNEYICKLNGLTFSATRNAQVDNQQNMLLLDGDNYFHIFKQDQEYLLRGGGNLHGELRGK